LTVPSEKAAAEGRTLTSLIEDGLRLVSSGSGKSPKAKRILPRISKASGGVMPGIDLSDSAALQEMEGLEYIERLNHGFK
jgi:hypothetical protein